MITLNLILLFILCFLKKIICGQIYSLEPQLNYINAGFANQLIFYFSLETQLENSDVIELSLAYQDQYFFGEKINIGIREIEGNLKSIMQIVTGLKNEDFFTFKFLVGCQLQSNQWYELYLEIDASKQRPGIQNMVILITSSSLTEKNRIIYDENYNLALIQLSGQPPQTLIVKDSITHSNLTSEMQDQFYFNRTRIFNIYEVSFDISISIEKRLMTGGIFDIWFPMNSGFQFLECYSSDIYENDLKIIKKLSTFKCSCFGNKLIFEYNEILDANATFRITARVQNSPFKNSGCGYSVMFYSRFEARNQIIYQTFEGNSNTFIVEQNELIQNVTTQVQFGWGLNQKAAINMTHKDEDYCPIVLYKTTSDTEFMVYNNIIINFALNQTTALNLKNVLKFSSSLCNIQEGSIWTDMPLLGPFKCYFMNSQDWFQCDNIAQLYSNTSYHFGFKCASHQITENFVNFGRFKLEVDYNDQLYLFSQSTPLKVYFYKNTYYMQNNAIHPQLEVTGPSQIYMINRGRAHGDWAIRNQAGFVKNPFLDSQLISIVILLDIAGNENNIGSPIICGNLGKCGNNVNANDPSTVVRFNAMLNGEVFNLGEYIDSTTEKTLNAFYHGAEVLKNNFNFWGNNAQFQQYDDTKTNATYDPTFQASNKINQYNFYPGQTSDDTIFGMQKSMIALTITCVQPIANTDCYNIKSKVDYEDNPSIFINNILWEHRIQNHLIASQNTLDFYLCFWAGGDVNTPTSQKLQSLMSSQLVNSYYLTLTPSSQQTYFSYVNYYTSNEECSQTVYCSNDDLMPTLMRFIIKLAPEIQRYTNSSGDSVNTNNLILFFQNHQKMSISDYRDPVTWITPIGYTIPTVLTAIAKKLHINQFKTLSNVNIPTANYNMYDRLEINLDFQQMNGSKFYNFYVPVTMFKENGKKFENFIGGFIEIMMGTGVTQNHQILISTVSAILSPKASASGMLVTDPLLEAKFYGQQSNDRDKLIQSSSINMNQRYDTSLKFSAWNPEITCSDNSGSIYLIIKGRTMQFYSREQQFLDSVGDVSPYGIGWVIGLGKSDCLFAPNQPLDPTDPSIIGGVGVHFTIVSKGYNMFKNVQYSWPLASTRDGKFTILIFLEPFHASCVTFTYQATNFGIQSKAERQNYKTVVSSLDRHLVTCPFDSYQILSSLNPDFRISNIDVPWFFVNSFYQVNFLSTAWSDKFGNLVTFKNNNNVNSLSKVSCVLKDVEQFLFQGKKNQKLIFRIQMGSKLLYPAKSSSLSIQLFTYQDDKQKSINGLNQNSWICDIEIQGVYSLQCVFLPTTDLSVFTFKIINTDINEIQLGKSPIFLHTYWDVSLIDTQSYFGIKIKYSYVFNPLVQNQTEFFNLQDLEINDCTTLVQIKKIQFGGNVFQNQLQEPQQFSALQSNMKTEYQLRFSLGQNQNYLQKNEQIFIFLGTAFQAFKNYDQKVNRCRIYNANGRVNNQFLKIDVTKGYQPSDYLNNYLYYSKLTVSSIIIHQKQKNTVIENLLLKCIRLDSISNNSLYEQQGLIELQNQPFVFGFTYQEKLSTPIQEISLPIIYKNTQLLNLPKLSHTNPNIQVQYQKMLNYVGIESFMNFTITYNQDLPTSKKIYILFPFQTNSKLNNLGNFICVLDLLETKCSLFSDGMIQVTMAVNLPKNIPFNLVIKRVQQPFHVRNYNSQDIVLMIDNDDNYYNGITDQILIKDQAPQYLNRFIDTQVQNFVNSLNDIQRIYINETLLDLEQISQKIHLLLSVANQSQIFNLDYSILNQIIIDEMLNFYIAMTLVNPNDETRYQRVITLVKDQVMLVLLTDYNDMAQFMIQQTMISYNNNKTKDFVDIDSSFAQEVLTNTFSNARFHVLQHFDDKKIVGKFYDELDFLKKFIIQCTKEYSYYQLQDVSSTIQGTMRLIKLLKYDQVSMLNSLNNYINQELSNKYQIAKQQLTKTYEIIDFKSSNKIAFQFADLSLEFRLPANVLETNDQIAVKLVADYELSLIGKSNISCIIYEASSVNKTASKLNSGNCDVKYGTIIFLNITGQFVEDKTRIKEQYIIDIYDIKNPIPQIRATQPQIYHFKGLQNQTQLKFIDLTVGPQRNFQLIDAIVVPSHIMLYYKYPFGQESLSVYKGYFVQNNAKIYTSVDKLSAEDEFKSSFKYHLTKQSEKQFSIMGDNTIYVGKKQATIMVAAQSNSSSGHQLVEFYKTAGYKYIPMPLLDVYILEQLCDVNPSSQDFNIPLKGQSLPITFDFSFCIPIYNISIKAEFTQKQNDVRFIDKFIQSQQLELVMMGSQIQSTKVTFQIINYNLLSVLKKNAAQIKFSINGTNMAQFAPLKNINIHLASSPGIPMIYLSDPVSLDHNSFQFEYSCSEIGNLFFAYGIDKQRVGTALVSRMQLNTLGNQQNQSQINENDQYELQYVQIDISSNQRKFVVIQNVRAGLRYHLAGQCINQQQSISQRSVVTWVQPDNGSKYGVIEIRLSKMLTRYEQVFLACAIAFEALIEPSQLFTQYGDQPQFCSMRILQQLNYDTQPQEYIQIQEVEQDDSQIQFILKPNFYVSQDYSFNKLQQIFDNKQTINIFFAKILSKSILKSILIYKISIQQPAPEPYFVTQLPYVNQDQDKVKLSLYYPRFGEVFVTITFTSVDISQASLAIASVGNYSETYKIIKPTVGQMKIGYDGSFNKLIQTAFKYQKANVSNTTLVLKGLSENYKYYIYYSSATIQDFGIGDSNCYVSSLFFETKSFATVVLQSQLLIYSSSFLIILILLIYQ